jgi:hypothetical protein
LKKLDKINKDEGKWYWRCSLSNAIESAEDHISPHEALIDK